MLSSSEILRRSQALESRLQRADPKLGEYFPVLRSYVYLGQRPPRRDPSLETGRAALRLSASRSAFASFCGALRAFFTGVEGEQLFIAPALHRNVPDDRGYTSKHLDSLVRHYAGDDAQILEVGTAAIKGLASDSFTRSVMAFSRALARILPASQPARTITAAASAEFWPDARAGDPKPRGLRVYLESFRYARWIFRQVFRRSSVKEVYVVCYYGATQLALTAALQAEGVQVSEYQHGIQSNVHPLYNGWSHLSCRPACMPAQMLLWDDIAVRRLQRWAEGLEIQLSNIGNLWYRDRVPPVSTQAGAPSVLVALQLFPEDFNPALFDIIPKFPQVCWLLREHPRAPLSPGDRARLLGLGDKVRVDPPGKEPLEATLGRSVICITGYSTVGLEASMAGLTVIFTHANAREGLGEYVDGESVFYAGSQAEIEAVIGSVLGAPPLD